MIGIPAPTNSPRFRKIAEFVRFRSRPARRPVEPPPPPRFLIAAVCQQAGALLILYLRPDLPPFDIGYKRRSASAALYSLTSSLRCGVTAIAYTRR